MQTSVIVVGGGPVGLALAATLGNAGIPCVLRIPLRILADTFAEPRAAYGSRFILVRPDQYVAWTGDDLPADRAAVLRKVVGG